MDKSKRIPERSLVNKHKLILKPLMITLVALLGVSSVTFYSSKSFLLRQMQQDGLNLTRQITRQLANHYTSLEIINEMLENKIRIAARVLIRNRNNLSNEFLVHLTEDLDVDELHWLNKEGRILYSSVEGYLDWEPFYGHPLYDFLQSNEVELMEDIRPDAEFGVFTKYGAVRTLEGNLVQVGILADRVQELTKKFSYQSLVEELSQEENIVYALMMDADMQMIAYSDKANLGTTIHDKNSKDFIMQGKPYGVETYDSEGGTRTYHVTMPVIIEEKIIGAVTLGFSMKEVYASIYKTLINALVITMIMFMLFFWVQKNNIIKPVKELNKNIHQIDLRSNSRYRLPLVKEDTFLGLSYSINEILDETALFLEKLKENEEELKIINEEVSAAFQQLAASEEELRAQYCAIQSYTEKLESLKQKYEIAIKGTNSAVWEMNLEDKQLYLSDEFESIAGIAFKDKEDVHKILEELLIEEDKEVLLEEYRKYEKGEKEGIYCQVRIRDKAGNIKWLLISGKGIYNRAEDLKLINGILLDVTKMKEQEAYIKHLANHDALTGLPNRRAFMQKLKEEIHKEKQGAVMLLDLDNFKEINDTLGHVYGDKVLKEVAVRLKGMEDEKLFISRFGGDEFLILISDEESVSEIEGYIQRMLHLFKKPFIIKNTDLYINFSIGITLYPHDTKNINQLIMNADTAMYKVKQSGKNNYMFFDTKMLEKLKGKVEIASALREALKTEGFKLLYQPQIRVKTGELVGFEALLRLKDQKISPDLFIPVAEETGLIIEIGKWVTKEVINQIAVWKEKGLKLKPIAINFSAKQLNDEKYLEFLEEALKEKSVNPAYIEIEITEGILLERTESTIAFLNQLKGIGVKIALDDFGTGYSSLSYLTFIPVNKIKLDKSLNDKFLEIENIKVMDSLISLVHSLGLEVIAEGIEEEEQYKRLKIGGCDYIQGYLFSKPLAIEEIEKIYNHNFLEKIN
ncbi:PAS domain S-box/diguanylate cyclase (GGDEF) domain-containing protein [Clostridium aceticum]|uniref:PAS domain S-box/diguanylate cyclase (GGDEF) domain-containing protein n=1 Tax=Clostridium aceticum TaxID=84022 RepID=A0A0G3W5W0_9CLOT|nr:EAL domain-containing protein [Clostridium aceticum]AKL94021.1 PAS domain S-box/diguanylate cyclase (GGDEF) domain-containing protein [Clostridium aceticum]